MLRLISTLLLVVSLIASKAQSALIRMEGSHSSEPFGLVCLEEYCSLALVLQIANELSTHVFISSWQLVDLELRPLDDAQGALLFQSATAPDNPLFGPVPGPQSDLTTPASKLSAFDTDPDFEGVPILPNSARSILQLHFGTLPGTAGVFQLLMPAGDDPELSSSWFDVAPGQFRPKAFGNSTPSGFAGFVLLGTVHVVAAPDFSPGDYNRDTQIDSLDYAQWRTEFGSTVTTPGDGADGNRDGQINAADYVVWRANAFAGTQLSSGQRNSQLTIPEPNALVLTLYGSVGILGPIRRTASRNARHFDSTYFPVDCLRAVEAVQ